ncbi:uncharacterized protein LOC130589840 [Beta vulgaris subsp. vulgaris]|uniref:uncharacterized protein LOC130589840 n=1 Tax=Beta vulgaris subsp. vulgaris TaxID=3555 RepID=UPI0025471506|nr:uncharacterized protein LOC130589840 [Beta vulgaris subsp. vulgaris]
MACVKTVSYSILINGRPSPPFSAKKGLRQGDPLSPYLFALSMEYLSRDLEELSQNPDFNFHTKCERVHLTHLMFADDLLLFCRADHSSMSKICSAIAKFSTASGLHISPEKSNIYLAGVNNEEADGLIEVCNMQLGTLPFKYLGITLSAKKLTYSQCNTIESKKAPIAWSRFYDPKSYGGWNLVNMTLWNKAAMLKLLWAIAYKSDRLWVNWVHAYYIKRLKYTTVSITANTSWLLRKIIDTRENLNLLGGWNEVSKAGKFSIKQAYKLLQGAQPSVPWKRLICNNHASPKSKFIVWLAIHNRLATTDRLIKWNVPCRATCSLCDRDDESVQHLFFACAYSASIWRMVCQIICITSSGDTFDQECAKAIAKARGSTRQARIYTMCFSESIYAVWGQRNNKIFNGKCLDSSQVVKDIIFRVEPVLLSSAH